MNARKFAFLANVNLFFSNIIKYKGSRLLKWVKASDTYSTVPHPYPGHIRQIRVLGGKKRVYVT